VRDCKNRSIGVQILEEVERCEETTRVTIGENLSNGMNKGLEIVAKTRGRKFRLMYHRRCASRDLTKVSVRSQEGSNVGGRGWEIDERRLKKKVRKMQPFELEMAEGREGKHHTRCRVESNDSREPAESTPVFEEIGVSRKKLTSRLMDLQPKKVESRWQEILSNGQGDGESQSRWKRRVEEVTRRRSDFISRIRPI
jgi:hypothetical protein